MKRLHCALLIASSVTGLVACGDDEPSAKEQFCAQRLVVADTIETIGKNLADRNYGSAREAADTLPDELEQLRTLAAPLQDDVAAAVQPSLDELTASLGAIRDSSTLEELSAAVDAAGSALTGALEAANEAASC